MGLILRKLKAQHYLLLILLLAAFLRLYRLDFPNKFIFDEVYHAFTAKEYLAGNKEAWEYWTDPPEGVAYEWTHPPLAKEIMAASMFVFNSQDAWAWRLPGALLGVLSVYLIYLLSQKLLRKAGIALITAFIFSIDGLNFVQSRIGMNDIYFLTFVLSSLLLLLNKRYIFSAIFLGLALSSKWTTIYCYPLFLFVLLKNKKIYPLLYYFVIPIIIYLISYLPFFLLKHNFSQFIELQQQMWWYHTKLKATHTYSSPWWSWPLNLYPVWYFVDYQKNTIANIFASGNPVLFWLGSTAFILTGLETFKKRSFNLSVIILGGLVFWLPWALSPRIMFLYHFSPSIPFLSLSLGYQLKSISDELKKPFLIVIILGLITITFILLYPFLTGLPIPKELVKLFFLTNISKNPFNN